MCSRAQLSGCLSRISVILTRQHPELFTEKMA
jgi:hypothetical protein